MKKLYLSQVIILLAGVCVAWYAVVNDFVRFYQIEGTIFKIQDCYTPNPVTTPCFWGAWAFLIALVWAYLIYRKTGGDQRKHQKWLKWLLLGGTIFAWSNFARELFKFYNRPDLGPAIGCSGQMITSPWLTPCFYGSALFLLALVCSLMILKKSKSNETPQPSIST